MQATTIPGDDSDTRPSFHRAAGDPHGQAALLLSESILHALIETKTFTLAQAIGVVQTASEVTADIGDESEETEEAKSQTRRSLNLLSAIEQSLAGGIDEAGMDNVRPLRP